MYIFLLILIVLASLLLVGIVLIQKSKGGGLASDYSSGKPVSRLPQDHRLHRKSHMGVWPFSSACSASAPRSL